MERITRRTLLAGSVAARVLGAGDRVNVAVAGLGGRGMAHVSYLLRSQDAHIAALCDVNQAAQERAVAAVEKAAGHKPKVYADMRRLFEDKQVDAVYMATPNHWHALGAIWACQAGKDVYVEKPACHNVWEGQRLIEAAGKYKRMVQVGSQSRSTAMKMRAMQLLREGIIGKVYMAKGLCYKLRPTIGRTPDSPTPPGVDWDQFRGPAPMCPFSQNRFKYNWHWFWDTGNGDIGNQGVHEVDICLWGLGETGMPKSVVSTGGKFLYDDDQETPNMQLATFDYGDRQVVFEVRGMPTGSEADLAASGPNIVGNLFFGSEGYMTVDTARFRVFKGPKREKTMEEEAQGPDGGYDSPAHFASFLRAVRSRNPKDLTADAEVGVRAASLCHLANISYRLGRKLAFDPAGLKFIGDSQANAMLTRQYRAPYVVPGKV